MENEKKRQLHVISTGNQSREELVEISKIIHPYVDILHLREKKWTGKELTETIGHLAAAGVPLRKLCINDRADIACINNVRGVQLGYHSAPVCMVKNVFPSLKIGASVHTIQEGQKAHEQGADYLIYGNIYSTPSKPGKIGTGVERLREFVLKVPVPVIAIGGITPIRVKEIVIRDFSC
jgi:thiazole tautomerase (transcriptional regulator TenI)